MTKWLEKRVDQPCHQIFFTWSVSIAQLHTAIHADGRHEWLAVAVKHRRRVSLGKGKPRLPLRVTQELGNGVRHQARCLRLRQGAASLFGPSQDGRQAVG